MKRTEIVGWAIGLLIGFAVTTAGIISLTESAAPSPKLFFDPQPGNE